MADHDEGMWAAMMDQHASHGMMTEDSFEHPTIPRWFKIVGLVIGLIVFVMILGPLITFLLSFTGLGSGVLNAFADAINALAQYLPWILGLLTALPLFNFATEHIRGRTEYDTRLGKAILDGEFKVPDPTPEEPGRETDKGPAVGSHLQELNNKLGARSWFTFTSVADRINAAKSEQTGGDWDAVVSCRDALIREKVASNEGEAMEIIEKFHK